MRYSNRLVWLITAVIVILMIIGSLYDYRIGQLLYDPTSFFALFIAAYGQMPCLWGFVLCAYILMQRVGRNTVKYPALLFVLALAILISMYVYAAAAASGSFSGWTTYVYAFLLLFLPPFLFFKYIASLKDAVLMKVFWFILIVCGGSLLTVTVLKEIWLRPRFRTVVRYDQIPYVEWWQIHSTAYGTFAKAFNLEKDAFLSFPSAHTSCAACLLCMSVLCAVRKKCRRLKTPLVLIGIGAAILTGAGRMVAGAHYLTDVTAGFAVTFAFYLFAYNWIFIRKPAVSSSRS